MILQSLTPSVNPRVLPTPFLQVEIYESTEKVSSSPLSERASELVSWLKVAARDLFPPTTLTLGTTKGAGMDDVDMIAIKAESEQISFEYLPLFTQVFI